MVQPAVEERRVTSYDGTDIAYHVVGRGRPVLLCNGLGGSWVAWTHQIRYLSDRYRFISWDYRGLYRSGPPATPGALQIDAHARRFIGLSPFLVIGSGDAAHGLDSSPRGGAPGSTRSRCACRPTRVRAT